MRGLFWWGLLFFRGTTVAITSSSSSSSSSSPLFWWDPLTLSQRQMWMFTNMMRMFPWRFQQKWNNIEFICPEAQSGSLPILPWCSLLAEATEFQAETLLDPVCSVRYSRGNTDTCTKFCNDSCVMEERIHRFCPECRHNQEVTLQGSKISPIAALEWWSQDRDSCPILFNDKSAYVSAAQGISTEGIIPDVFVQDFVETCPNNFMWTTNPFVVHVVWNTRITCFYSFYAVMDKETEDNARLKLCTETREGIPMNLLFEDDARVEKVWELCFSPYLWTHFCGDTPTWETVLWTQNYSSTF